MMLITLHLLLMACYLLLPPFALAMEWATARRHRQRRGLARFGLTVVSGTVIGLSISLVYAKVTGGRIQPTQVLLAAYFATGLLLLLKLFDALVTWSVRRVFRLPTRTDASPKPPFLRSTLAGLLRLVILVGFALPYSMVAILTYRPKVTPIDDPRSQLGYAFERVEFESTDGTNLVGWWIPALTPARSSEPWDGWGKQTVIVCHGLAADKSNHLILARAFPPDGFNVLIFDFRAHGESGGQLATFGDLERRDVLGAVRWLRTSHPDESRRIVGVGASLGGAALIAAAAERSAEGQAIKALAVYGTYDDLPRLARTITRNYFYQPMRWMLFHIGLPLASVQVGTDLSAFAPADLAPDLWPRPILILHGFNDEIIDFSHGQRLYGAATQPKYRLWLKGYHNTIIDSQGTAKIVVEFFKVADDVPVI